MQEADLQNSTVAKGGFFVFFSGSEKTRNIRRKTPNFSLTTPSPYATIPQMIEAHCMKSSLFFQRLLGRKQRKGMGAEVGRFSSRSCWQQEIRVLSLSQKCGELSYTADAVSWSAYVGSCQLQLLFLLPKLRLKENFRCKNRFLLAPPLRLSPP